MNLIIADVLSDAQLSAISEVLADATLYRDGAQTAGALARPVKHNLQARDGPKVESALALIGDALLAHPILRSAARPKCLVRIMANRYESGMHYGNHVDDPIIAGERTDLSFTLMLSDPMDYDGGELVIESDDQTQLYRLARGELLLYPAHTLHRVETVSRGQRVAIVGWIRSWIADAAQREVLFDLDRVVETLLTASTERTTLDRLQRARARLMRMWAQ
ncbi:MAG: Fe2+-dependent dioxygenase [Pseudomarimonas sp.]